MKRARIWLAIVLGTVTPTAAWAEAGAPRPTCQIELRPRGGAKIPANAPALVALTNDASGVKTTLGAGKLTPAEAVLTTVPDPRSRALLLVPDAELKPTPQLQLSIEGTCSDSIEPKATTTFEVGPSAPLPTVAGTLALGTPKADQRATPIVFTPSVELAPFLPLTMFDLKVAGKPEVWGTVAYGNALPTAGAVELGIGWRDALSRGITSKIGLCADGDVGKKTIALTLEAHVAGATSDPPAVPLDVTIECDPPPAPPPVGPSDGGVDDAGATNGSDLEGGGCSASTSPALSSSGGLALVAVGLVLGGVARRRRSNRA